MINMERLFVKYGTFSPQPQEKGLLENFSYKDRLTEKK